MRRLIGFIIRAGFLVPMLSAALLMALSGNASGLTIAVINRTAAHIAAARLTFFDGLLFSLTLAGFLFLKRQALHQTITLSERVVEAYRLNVANLIRQAELLHIEHVGEEDIYQKLTRDAQKVSQAIRRILKGFEAVMVAAFVFAYMLWQYSGAAFVVLAFNGIVVVLYLIFRELLHPLLHAVSDGENDLFQLVRHVLDGFKELKIDQEKNTDLVDRYVRVKADEVSVLRIRLSDLFAVIEITFDTLYYLGIGSVLFLFTPDVTTTIRVQVVAMILFLWTRIYRIYVALPYLSAADVAVERLDNLAAQFRLGITPSSHVSTPEPMTDFQEIAFENLTFQYTDHEGQPTYTIGPLSLRIQPGEILFIRGGNGSGKTTLVKLLIGLYPPFSGRVAINGSETDMTAHRDLFTPIFSDAHIFARLYGVGMIDDQRVHELLRLMELDHKTGWRDQRFTDLNLSTGQRKRLALITAMLEDKPVYVFDEWAAEQDPHFRAYFYDELLPAFKAQGKAVIVVTHDERYFHRADRMLTMQDGCIVAEA